MKKTISLLLTGFMILSLTVCKASANPKNESSSETVQAQDSAAEKDESVKGSQTESSADTETPSESGKTETQPTETEGSNILVAYFSATGTTKGVAETIAEELDADLYEITPAEPYTDADLDYNDDNSRSSVEMNDPSARPEISGSVENMEQYDIVFLGYPIWWAEAPRIMSTFVESYDFSGKTVIPFCTSAASGIGDSGDNLEELTSDAVWLEGSRFSGEDSEDAIMEWVNSLELNE